MKNIRAHLIAAFALPLAPLLGSVRLSGNAVAAEALLAPHQLAVEAMLREPVAVSSHPNTAAVTEVVAGDCDAALVAQPLDALLAGASGSVSASASRDLQYQPVSELRLQFSVHPSNAVERLTSDQLRGILTGKITNWEEVGGPDRPIVVVVPSESLAAETVVRSAVMHELPYVNSAISAGRLEDVADKVRLSPGAIGVTVMGSGGEQGLKALITVPLRLPLAFVTLGEPNRATERLMLAFRISLLKSHAARQEDTARLRVVHVSPAHTQVGG